MGGDLSRREYQSDEFDRMFLAGHAGPRWLFSRSTEASLLASARQSWLSDEPDYYDLGFRLSGGHRIDRRTTTSFNASWHDRRYAGRPWLDGPLVDAAGGARLGRDADDPPERGGGLGPAADETGERAQYVALDPGRCHGAVALGLHRGRIRHRALDRLRGQLALRPRRRGRGRDRTYSVRLNVLNRAFALRGFSPQLSVVHEWRRSNAQLHDYRRTFGEMRLVRLF